MTCSWCTTGCTIGADIIIGAAIGAAMDLHPEKVLYRNLDIWTNQALSYRATCGESEQMLSTATRSAHVEPRSGFIVDACVGIAPYAP